MDEISRMPINKLLALVFALLGAMRLVAFARSGDPLDAISGVGFVLVAFSGYRRGLAQAPQQRANSAQDRAAAVAGYFGIALLLWAIVRRLLT